MDVRSTSAGRPDRRTRTVAAAHEHEDQLPGAAGFEITWGGKRLLVDPFLTGSPAAPLSPDALETPDLILVCHAALDRLGDTAAIAKRTGAPIICGGEVRAC